MKKHLQFALLVPVAMGIAASFVWACSDDETKPPAAGTSTSSGSTGNTTSSSGTSGASSGTSGASSGTSGTSGTPIKARATIASTSDASTVSGNVEFSELGDETTVTINITSGGVAGNHGMHIHANPSCEATDAGPALAAGGHWNPADAGHGFPTGTPHHLGDLGNVMIDANGSGQATLKSKEFKVSDGPTSVVNHAVVYHASPDDGVSQPVGNAGARPGCGVIVKQ